jgi:hypothetical protein
VNFPFGIFFLLWVHGLVRGLEKPVLKNKLVVPLAGTVPRLTLKRALSISDKELQRIPRRLRRGLLRARQRLPFHASIATGKRNGRLTEGPWI